METLKPAHSIHTFELIEGDYTGNGHEQVLPSNLLIFTTEDVKRQDLIDNFKANLESLSFNISDLFNHHGHPGQIDLDYLRQLSAWMRYVPSQALDIVQAQAISALHVPHLIASMILCDKKGRIIGGTGSFSIEKTGLDLYRTRDHNRAEINDLVDGGNINYGGYFNRDCAFTMHMM